MFYSRKSVRKMQCERQAEADKKAAKLMGWPKAMRQYAKRYGQGAESARQLHAQIGIA